MPAGLAAVPELSRGECLALLGSVPVGLVVFTYRALPELVPVSFRLDGDGVVIRAGTESALAGVADGSVLAFHAHRIDQATRSGWSVTVLGRAAEIADESERQRILARPLDSWLSGGRAYLLRIAAERVTGRRLG
jgi:nitroimidazol reductase NimA-like FMN-containing flavoprotein (pyridoxamine 5'-phosphate oxidase superfamily)